MTTKIAQRIIETPPASFADMQRMWTENFAVLKDAAIADNVVVASRTVENTTTKTVFSAEDFAPGDFVFGLCILINVSGIYSNASAADDFTITFQMDDTIYHTFGRLAGNVTDQYWECQFEMTVQIEGTSGKIISAIKFLDGGSLFTESEVTPHSIDTTIAHTINVDVKWDNAKVGNVFIMTQGVYQFFKGSETE